MKKELYDLHLIFAQTLSQREAMHRPRTKRSRFWSTPPHWRRRRAATIAYGRGQTACSAMTNRRPKIVTRGRSGDAHCFPRPFSLGRAVPHGVGPFRQRRGERKEWQADPKGLEKAAEEYRQGLRIDPDHYWLHFQLGRSYLSLGRLGEAVEALGACIALRPEAPWAYSVRGLASPNRIISMKRSATLTGPCS